jgi:hypothetical protein
LFAEGRQYYYSSPFLETYGVYVKIISEYISQMFLCEFAYLKVLYSSILKIKFGPKAGKVKGNGGNYHYQGIL